MKHFELTGESLKKYRAFQKRFRLAQKMLKEIDAELGAEGHDSPLEAWQYVSHFYFGDKVPDKSLGLVKAKQSGWWRVGASKAGKSLIERLLKVPDVRVRTLQEEIGCKVPKIAMILGSHIGLKRVGKRVFITLGMDWQPPEYAVRITDVEFEQLTKPKNKKRKKVELRQ